MGWILTISSAFDNFALFKVILFECSKKYNKNNYQLTNTKIYKEVHNKYSCGALKMLPGCQVSIGLTA